MTAPIVFFALLAALTLFQLALAFGAPWGRFAWGGQHQGVLPVGYRVGSAVSIAFYGLMSFIAFDRSGGIDVFTDGFSRVGMWVVFGYLALGVLMNAVSRSKPERYLMTPVALALAVLSLVIALSAPAG